MSDAPAPLTDAALAAIEGRLVRDEQTARGFYIEEVLASKDRRSLLAEVRRLREALAGLLAVNPVFRNKPLGAPNSAIRAGQEAAIRAKDAARAALGEASNG